MLEVVPGSVLVRTPSKVNVHLGVGDRRPDGYHDLSTVFQALSLTDEVRIAPAAELSITVTGDSARKVPTDHTNLAARAARILGQYAQRDPHVAIAIDKGIPVAGGMAGGSADAAAVLVGLNRLWGLDIERSQLAELAADLGSDVPFAVVGGTALGTGRGERLVPALARGTFHWVLALAKFGLATPAVYGELDRLRAEKPDMPRVGEADAVIRALASGDAATLAPLLGNDLQAAALSMQPTLRRTLRAGLSAGALGGLVSGSGPTCAFLCESAESAVDVAAELSGVGVCRAVRTATGPVAGAQVIAG